MAGKLTMWPWNTFTSCLLWRHSLNCRCLSACVFTGNGYIEEKELESFFKELDVAWRGADMVSFRTSINRVTHADHPGFTVTFVFMRTPRTPCWKKKWRTLCRGLTKTKMDGLRCRRYDLTPSYKMFFFGSLLLEFSISRPHIILFFTCFT